MSDTSETQSPAKAHAVMCDLSQTARRIGVWATRTFGPTPLQVHAARMNEEMTDVLNAAAIGDSQRVGRALAGVLVVACAIAESEGLDLASALLAEQADNEAASWHQTDWGHWIRIGNGEVKIDNWAMLVVEGVLRGVVDVKRGAALLTERGATLSAAWEFLIDQGVALESDTTFAAADDLRPAARGVFDKVRVALSSNVITADGALDFSEAFDFNLPPHFAFKGCSDLRLSSSDASAAGGDDVKST